MLYILTLDINVAINVLEVIDNTLTESYVPTGHIVEQTGYSYSVAARSLGAMAHADVLTSKTGPRGGYKRAKTPTAKELAMIFSTRMGWPDKPRDELTKADRIQRTLVSILAKMKV